MEEVHVSTLHVLGRQGKKLTPAKAARYLCMPTAAESRRGYVSIIHLAGRVGFALPFPMTPEQRGIALDGVSGMRASEQERVSLSDVLLYEATGARTDDLQDT